jgi:hypothetical protein
MSPGVVVLTSRTDLGSTLVSRTVKLLLPDSDGNHVLAAAKPALAPLRVLLVGDHEEDFFLIRDMLERNRSLIAADLEHANTLEDARELI